MRNAARHDSESTSSPPIGWPNSARPDVDGRPRPERARPGRSLERRRDDRQRARNEQRAGRALEDAEQDDQLEVRGDPAEQRRDPEAGQADREDPPPAVVVGKGAGEDQQRRQHREVAADDVGLALEHAEERGRQPADRPAARGSRSCRRGRRSPSRGSPPARVHRSVRVIARQCRTGAAMLTAHARSQSPSWDRASSCPRWRSSTRACSPRPAAPGPASRSCRRRPGRTARRPSPAGRRWASPTSRRSARRSSRSRSGTASTPTTPPTSRRSARPTSSTCRAASPATCRRCCDGSGGRPGAPPGPRARRGHRRLLGRGDGPRRAALRHAPPAARSGRVRWRDGLGLVAGASVVPHYDAWPEPLSRAARAPGAARLGRARDRRGDGDRRPRRLVAGPRPGPRHRLARPPPRAVPRRGRVPALGARHAERPGDWVRGVRGRLVEPRSLRCPLVSRA